MNFLPKAKYEVMVLLLFVTLGLFGISFHEIWRDEAHAWLLVRNHHSILELFKSMKYEGHPGLFHILLYPLSALFISPLAMQLFHLFIATAVVTLVMLKSPFTKFQKLFFTFSYFSLFEYGVISRNYGLGNFFIFLSCSLYGIRHKNFLFLSLAIFLAAHSSTHAFLIAFSLSLVLALEQVRNKSFRAAWKGWVVIGFGFLTAYLQASPAKDAAYAADWKFFFDPERLKKVINLFSQSFLAIPQFDPSFWRTNFFENFYSFRRFEVLISIIFPLGTILLIRKNFQATFFYCLATIALLSLFYFKHVGGVRHAGLLFVASFSAIWISALGFKCGAFTKPEKILSFGFTCILFIQLVGGFKAIFLDKKHPFSVSKAAAHWIKKNNYSSFNFVAHKDYAAEPIAAYLDKTVFFPQGNRWGSFVRWDYKRKAPVSELDIMTAAEILEKTRKNPSLIISNRELRLPNFIFLKSFSGSSVPMEDIFLYRLKKGPL